MGVDAPFIGAEGLLMYKVYSTLSTARLSLGNLPDPEGHLGISPYCTTPPTSGLDVVRGGGALPRPTPAFRPFPSSEGPPFRRPGVSFPSGPSREGTVPGSSIPGRALPVHGPNACITPVQLWWPHRAGPPPNPQQQPFPGVSPASQDCRGDPGLN